MLTRGCLISTPSNTVSSAVARDLISLAIARGDCNGIRYIVAGQGVSKDTYCATCRTHDHTASSSTDTRPCAYLQVKRAVSRPEHLLASRQSVEPTFIHPTYQRLYSYPPSQRRPTRHRKCRMPSGPCRRSPNHTVLRQQRRWRVACLHKW